MLKNTTNNALVQMANAFEAFKLGVEADTLDEDTEGLEEGAEKPRFTVVSKPEVSLYTNKAGADFHYLLQMVSNTFVVAHRYKDGRLLCKDFTKCGVVLNCIVDPDPDGEWRNFITDDFTDWFDQEDAPA